MVVFPNCKINLGLNILNKREDGYHNLETIFYPVAVKDALEILPGQGNGVEFGSTGLPAGNADDNLCIKAYRLLKNDLPQLPAVRIHLHKAIPVGAGLGGGSADAAFTLRSLNDKFSLGLSTDQLINYALQLGSDCPFFIINKPCFATGRGEKMEETALDLSAYRIILINPGIHINTGWAFSQITPCIPGKPIKEIISQPIETWKDELANDFEKAVFAAHPEVKEVKEGLYQQGALYASMSGSGSTVFGIFDKDISDSMFKDKGYFTRIIK